MQPTFPAAHLLHYQTNLQSHASRLATTVEGMASTTHERDQELAQLSQMLRELKQQKSGKKCNRQVRHVTCVLSWKCILTGCCPRCRRKPNSKWRSLFPVRNSVPLNKVMSDTYNGTVTAVYVDTCTRDPNLTCNHCRRCQACAYSKGRRTTGRGNSWERSWCIGKCQQHVQPVPTGGGSWLAVQLACLGRQHGPE